MRAELNRLLEATRPVGRAGWASFRSPRRPNGYVRLRALASAADAPTLFDLRCYVREGLVAWLQEQRLHALPRTRVEGVEAVGRVAGLPGAASSGTLADSPSRSAGRPA